MKARNLFLVFVLFSFLPTTVWAADPSSKPPENLDVKIKPNLKAESKKIYTITVNLKKSGRKVYHVAYDLDGVYRKEFSDQVVPFSFDDNFSGLQPGEHTVKIDLDDEKNQVVATQTVHLKLE